MSKYKIRITPRDRLMRAWESSTGLVRDYRAYALELGRESELGRLFAEYAEEEGHHAARLLELLHREEER